MATHPPGSAAWRGALLGGLLVLLGVVGAHAEEWPLVLARRVVRMGAVSVESQPRPTLVRIGVLFDPRQRHAREEAENQVQAFRAVAAGEPSSVDFHAELVAVDAPGPLTEIFARHGFRIVLLPHTLGDAEWALVLSLAARHHVGTVAAIPRRLYSPTEIRRLGPATFVFVGDGGEAAVYADAARARLEGIFGARVLGMTRLVRPAEAPPANPSGAAP